MSYRHPTPAATAACQAIGAALGRIDASRMVCPDGTIRIEWMVDADILGLSRRDFDAEYPARVWLDARGGLVAYGFGENDPALAMDWADEAALVALDAALFAEVQALLPLLRECAGVVLAPDLPAFPRWPEIGLRASALTIAARAEARRDGQVDLDLVADMRRLAGAA